MLADCKLYWDPESNLLFFPEFETTRSDGADTTGDFDVHEFRPDCPGISGCPRFNAVMMFSFGTWGLLPRERILGCLKKAVDACLAGRRMRLYRDKSTNMLFRRFVKSSPEIGDARFAVAGDCAKRRGWGIPLTAKIGKRKKSKESR